MCVRLCLWGGWEVSRLSLFTVLYQGLLLARVFNALLAPNERVLWGDLRMTDKCRLLCRAVTGTSGVLCNGSLPPTLPPSASLITAKSGQRHIALLLQMGGEAAFQ